MTQAVKKRACPSEKTEKEELFLSVKKTVDRTPSFLKDDCNLEIEFFVARIWEKALSKHIPEALEDLESLQFVPLQIRRKLAIEPLFIARYE